MNSRSKDKKRIYAIICASCTAVSMVVQLLIALGLPLGELVLGGLYTIAPMEKRMIHATFAVIWAVVMFAYLAYGTVIPFKRSLKAIKMILILNTLFVLYAVVWNFFLTGSRKEALVMGPLTAVTSIFSIALLLPHPNRPGDYKRNGS